MLLPLLGWQFACGLQPPPADKADDAAADGADTDTDTDADTDSDADADADTDPLPEDFCDRALDASAPAGPACVTATLACGDSVEGTLGGGRSEYVASMYEGWYCTPNLDLDPYDGPERVYAVDLPAHTAATFELDTPCGDLDVFALYWPDASVCPDATDDTRECDAGDTYEDVETATIISVDAERDLVIVDGREGEQVNFRLTVRCE